LGAELLEDNAMELIAKSEDPVATISLLKAEVSEFKRLLDEEVKSLKENLPQGHFADRAEYKRLVRNLRDGAHAMFVRYHDWLGRVDYADTGFRNLKTEEVKS